jgi:glycosyltransferase involved in cell wall biosynthesis
VPQIETGLVTTIIPVFNRAVMLREAVASVLAQTYRPIEIVIVDDGSTDETAQTAEALAADHPEVRLIRQPNRGVGAAREAARLVARGEFIQHLDSDDVLYPRKFELQVAGLRAHPECDISYGWTRLRMADGTLSETPARRTGERIEAMFPSMLRERWWHTPNPLYRASVIHRAGPWLPLCNEEDWEYDARIAAAGVRLHHTPEWICEFRHHDAPRLSGRGYEPSVLRDRATAHARIFEHARHARIDDQTLEMQHFARELFLLARQCGAAGLVEDSERLFYLSRNASGRARDRLQLKVYWIVARMFGWTAAARIAGLRDIFRAT